MYKIIAEHKDDSSNILFFDFYEDYDNFLRKFTELKKKYNEHKITGYILTCEYEWVKY